MDSFIPSSLVDVEGPRKLNEPDDYDPSTDEPHNPPPPDSPPPPEGGSGFTLPPVNVYITVEGSMDEGVADRLTERFRDTMKELFTEFRNEENEEMALKEQYAF